MKKIMLLCLLLTATHVYAQPSRDMTKEEVDFTNRVSNVLLNSLPKEFKDWTVNFPEYTPAVVGETRTSNCNFGKDCYHNLYFHVVYDGTTLESADRQAFQDSARTVGFDWHYVALFGRYTNSHQLVVDISVNETSYIGDFRYCGAKGYTTMPAPAAFDHYLFATVTPCFPHTAQKDIPDVNLFVLGNLPVVTDHLDNGVSKSSILFKLNPALSSPFKIQNVVVRMYGSRKLAKEFLEKMDAASLRKLMK